MSKIITTDNLLDFGQQLAAKEDLLLNGKVDKVDGKQLSTNDYTTAEKNKLASLNNYTHPSYTSRASGLYKIVVDATGHISQAAAVTKTDITALGIPAQDTTYSLASSTANGLMSKEDKTKLDGMSYATDSDIDAIITEIFG